ncbi:hypothetical protein E2C01_097693 [Portunus trituberculatus]|uniref:Uncharacterized protein n=1 Tax=Portunus trituberculatus TaxID=210409 RepID=A0A5B7KC24_PORTR|nr:hypothetical protein [Portunus trituberculatus]
MTLKPKMTYLRQQDTSLWSRRYRLAGILVRGAAREPQSQGKCRGGHITLASPFFCHCLTAFTRTPAAR